MIYLPEKNVGKGKKNLSLKKCVRIVFLAIILITVVSTAFSQDVKNPIYPRNTLDVQMLGNKGFIAVGYNRALLGKHKFNWLVGPSVGFVPGSSEDSAHAIPRYYHLNIGSGLSYRRRYSEITAGASYSRILLSDPYHSSPKSAYNRVLGDFGYVQYFNGDGVILKIAFTPMLYDDGTDDVQNIPVAVVFRVGI